MLQDLLLVSLFPHLAQIQLLDKESCFVLVNLQWWVHTPSAPGLLLGRSETLPSHPQKLSSCLSFGGCKPGLNKTPAGFANGLFESVTFNFLLSHIPSYIPVSLVQCPSFVPLHPTARAVSP